MTDDALIIFLGAREAEREAKARAVQDGSLAHIADNDPESVLADVAAKHKILDRAQELWDAHSLATPQGDALGEHTETVLPALALPYVTHPDFRTAWKP